MTEEDEEFERIEKKRQSLIDYLKEPISVSKQKEWMDLTGAEVKAIRNVAKSIDDAIYMAERKLKEKNYDRRN
jgi:hypothetical protein